MVGRMPRHSITGVCSASEKVELLQFIRSVWSSRLVLPSGPPVWSSRLVLPSGPPVWSSRLVLPSGPPVWSSRLAHPSGPPVWSSRLVLPPGPPIWSSRLVLPSGPPVWSSHLVLPSGPPVWSSRLVLPSGPPVWSSRLVLPSGPPVWSSRLVRTVFVRRRSVAVSVTNLHRSTKPSLPTNYTRVRPIPMTRYCGYRSPIDGHAPLNRFRSPIDRPWRISELFVLCV
jgi:hypothetical protein